MTSETRIGLIVGLMFIVLFGVVLSELGTSGEIAQNETDAPSGRFYVEAPVIRTPEVRPQPEERALTATEAPGRPAERAPRRTVPEREPRRTPPTRRTTPPRPTPPVTTPPRTIPPVTTPPRGGHIELTPEQLAAYSRTGRSRVYVTRRGDNLTALARKFYRTSSRKAVMKIFNANRTVLRSPDTLGVGVKIVIPN